MKKIVLLLSSVFLFCLPGFLFSAEISERKDLAIFGLTYYSYDIPDSVLGYVDSSISHVFINLKRFNVLGYGNYRIESRDIDDFIKRIRETQAAKAKEAGTYDDKFGTVVISGENFDRIVGSFLVPMCCRFWAIRRAKGSSWVVPSARSALHRAAIIASVGGKRAPFVVVVTV